jgi:hypothetical protein
VSVAAVVQRVPASVETISWAVKGPLPPVAPAETVRVEGVAAASRARACTLGSAPAARPGHARARRLGAAKLVSKHGVP